MYENINEISWKKWKWNKWKIAQRHKTYNIYQNIHIYVRTNCFISAFNFWGAFDRNNTHLCLGRVNNNDMCITKKWKMTTFTLSFTYMQSHTHRHRDREERANENVRKAHRQLIKWPYPTHSITSLLQSLEMMFWRNMTASWLNLLSLNWQCVYICLFISSSCRSLYSVAACDACLERLTRHTTLWPFRGP